MGSSLIFSGVQDVTADGSELVRPRPVGPRSVGALLLVAMLCIVACSRDGTRGSDRHPAPRRPRTSDDPAGRGPTDTGVPAGTELTRSGSIDVRAPGTVIAGRDVHGTIHVHADDVTIRDTRVTSGDYWPIWLDPGRRGLEVFDTEVVGSGSCQAGIGTHDYLAVRLDVHGCGDGAKAGANTTISSSWFHDLRVTPGSHNDGIQVSIGSHVVIRGNRIDGPVGQTSAIKIGPDYGSAISDVVVADNWLNGGAYTLYLDAADAVVRGNRFGRSSAYGPVAVTTTPKVWVDNVWADTGRPVNP
jgi:hypothetical protein